ncbi:hypothetical protein Tco_1264856, partial [Tanacetum coccineum]
MVTIENELLSDITIAGLKKKSGKKTVVEKNIKSVAAPIRAKKNKMGKKVVVEKNQVSVNEPTATKKKNTGKKADVEMHRVSIAEPTSEKVIPAKNLDIKGLMLQKAILVRLLDDFSEKKATKALGYLLAVTTLDKIGERKASLSYTGLPVTVSPVSGYNGGKLNINLVKLAGQKISSSNCLEMRRLETPFGWIATLLKRRARFSFMGGKGGALWKQITFRLSDPSEVTCESGGHISIEDAQGLFTITFLEDGFFYFMDK